MTSDISASSSIPSPIEASILSPRYRMSTLGMVALVALMAFETLAVTTAMPTVARELDGLRLYGLAFGSTLATSVVGMVLAGHYCDRIGPGRPLWLGLCCFVAGLLLAGLANRMATLIAGRLLQGLGTGACSVALYVAVAQVYPQTLLPRVFSAFSAGWVVPSLLGPTLSGWIAQHLGWRWVFLAVPVLAIPAALMLRPMLAHLQAKRGTALKPAVAILWAIGAAAGMLLLYLGGQQHTAAPASVLVAMALLALCSLKLLPPGTLRLARGLPSVIALRGLVASAIFSCEAFFPLLLSRERGLSPIQAGIALSIGALGWFCGSWYQGHARAGWSRKCFLKIGTTLLLIGLAATASVLMPSVPLWLAVSAWAIANIGMGLVYSSLSVLTLELSPAQQQGANSAALQLSEAIAVATVMAVVGSLFGWLVQQNANWGYASVFVLSCSLIITAHVAARRV